MISQGTVNAASDDWSDVISSVPIGDPAPDFTLYDFYNNSMEYNMSTFAGKVVLFDLMASWCGPCQASMPEMRDLYQAFNSTGEFDIISIGIDKSEPDSDLEWFHETFGMDWKFSRDYYGAMPNNSSFNAAYGTGYIPTYYLIDKAGDVVQSEIGWYGIDHWYDEVNLHINATDEVDPQIISATDSITAGTQLVFNQVDPTLGFTVRATDNWSVKQVSVVIGIGNSSSTFKLTRSEDRDLWTGTKTFLKDVLLNIDNITLSYNAYDYVGNVVTIDGGMVKLSPVIDTVTPNLFSAIAKIINDGNNNKLKITIGAKDDIYLLLPTVEFTMPCGGEMTSYTMEKGVGTLYNLEIDLTKISSLDGYLLEVILEDLGGNILRSVITVDGVISADEYSCSSTMDTTSGTIESTSVNKPPFPYLVSLLSLLAIPVIRRKF